MVSAAQSPMSTGPAAAAPDQRQPQHEPPTVADAPQPAGPTAAAAPEPQPEMYMMTTGSTASARTDGVPHSE